MLKSLLDFRQIGYLIFYVTNRCNFQCKFCFYYEEIEKGLKPDEMTLEEIARLTRRLGPLLQLSLTGGEPFLRQDLAEITRLFVEDCSARYITIPTNAWLTDSMVKYLETVLPRHPHSYLRFTNSGSWGDISLIVRRQTGTRERENGQIVRCNAAWGG